MSVRQFLIFLTLSAFAFAAAFMNRQLLGAGTWILGYFAVNLLLIAIAYGGGGPALFRKRVSRPRHQRAVSVYQRLSFPTLRLCVLR